MTTTGLDKIIRGIALVCEGQDELDAALLALISVRELGPDFDALFDELGVALELVGNFYDDQSRRMAQTDAALMHLNAVLHAAPPRERIQ